MFADAFVGNPKNRVFYYILKFAANACITALGVKEQKTKGETMPWEA